MLDKIKTIIDEAENMKGAYFWKPSTNAGGRRSYEKKHSHPKIEWEEGGHLYTAEFVVECSCRYIYVKGIYTRDGERTTLTAIKNSYKRLLKNS